MGLAWPTEYISTELATLLVLRSLFGLRQWLTFEVFAPLILPEDLILLGDPLLTFCSSPESCCTDAVTHGLPSRMTASLAVYYPFDVFPVPGSHSPWRVPASRYVPSRRFSRPQGLSPPGTCQPCFMLVPPLGFTLQGRYPPAEPIILSDAVPSRGWRLFRSFVPAISDFPGSWGSLDLPRQPFEETVLRSSCPSSGPCSLRASVSTRSIV